MPITQGGLNIPNVKIQQIFLRARLDLNYFRYFLFNLLQSSKIENIWGDIFNKTTIPTFSRKKLKCNKLPIA